MKFTRNYSIIDNTSTYYAGGKNAEYKIEQVWAPQPKGYGWYATGPSWDGGYFGSLPQAKTACANHAESN